MAAPGRSCPSSKAHRSGSPPGSVRSLQFLDQRAAASGSPSSRATLSSASALCGKLVGLVIVDHLQPVFDRPQPVVAVAQRLRVVSRDDPLGCQCIERRARAAHPQRRLAPAVDQLVRLGEEFDLANPAAPALDVEARAGRLAGRHGGRGSGAVSRPISSIAPKSRLRRHTKGRIAARKASPARDIARAGPRADEGRPLPCERRGFVMRQRRVERDGQRRDLRGRAAAADRPGRHSLRDVWLESVSTIARATRCAASPGSSRSRRGSVAGS